MSSFLVYQNVVHQAHECASFLASHGMCVSSICNGDSLNVIDRTVPGWWRCKDVVLRCTTEHHKGRSFTVFSSGDGIKT